MTAKDLGDFLELRWSHFDSPPSLGSLYHPGSSCTGKCRTKESIEGARGIPDSAGASTHCLSARKQTPTTILGWGWCLGAWEKRDTNNFQTTRMSSLPQQKTQCSFHQNEGHLNQVETGCLNEGYLAHLPISFYPCVPTGARKGKSMSNESDEFSRTFRVPEVPVESRMWNGEGRSPPSKGGDLNMVSSRLWP